MGEGADADRDPVPIHVDGLGVEHIESVLAVNAVDPLHDVKVAKLGTHTSPDQTFPDCY